MTKKGEWLTRQDGHKGFVDLVMAKAGIVIFAELKTGYNKPSPDQLLWLEALRGSGRIAECWYPKDWERIITLLTTPVATVVESL